MLKFQFIPKPIFLLFALILLCSHDLYIKMETYFLQANQKATLSLYNGTFETSENIITRDRMLDASVVAQGKRVAIKPDQWKDQDSTITQLTFNTGEAGTYVVGVSTKAKNIALPAKEFNSYLEHDGVLDMLEQRTKDGLLDQDAVERYEKHIKAIYQVGDIKTKDWSTVLGYPLEFVPQANPYEKYSGEKLEVQLLADGKPLSQQLVFADHIQSAHAHTHEHEHDGEKHSHDHEHADAEHSHEHEHDGEKHSHEHEHDGEKHSHAHTHTDAEHDHKHESHTHTSGQQLRTNDQGKVLVDLPEDGIYYLRTIHMAKVSNNDSLTHRSKWATLTFEVSHKHGASTHTHDHDHGDGPPAWIFVVSSLLIIGLLFLVFRKKNQ